MNIDFLGKSIRKNREKLSLTQDKLADLLNVSTHYIYELERGMKLPSLTMLMQIAETFHVSIDSMLTESNEFNNDNNNLDLLLKDLSDSKKEKLYEILRQLLPYLNL